MAISGLAVADLSAGRQDRCTRFRFGIGRQCHATAFAKCDDRTTQHEASMRPKMCKERFQSVERADGSRRAERLDGHPIQISLLQSRLDPFVSP